MKLVKPMRVVVVAVCLVLAVGAARSDEPERIAELGDQTRKLLAWASGDPDPAVPHRVAAFVTSAELVSAFYRGSRTERLIAIDAADKGADRWALIPYVAALMGARDRRVASDASRALLGILDGRQADAARPVETTSGQVAQLAGQLASIAGDERLDADIRGAALGGIGRLAALGFETGFSAASLLEDPDREIRRAALTLVDIPIDAELLALLARIAGTDPDRRLRGQAAALLCENAQAHGVKAPSRDLAELLKKLLGDRSAPADAIGSVLPCLGHFESRSRADLVEIALGHPDEAVAIYWKALNTAD